MGALFRINPKPTFKAVVSLSLPGGDSAAIEFEFRHKPRKELKSWVEATVGRSDLDALAEVVAGWSGVADESGALVRYSVDALDQLLDNYPAASKEIYAAYLRELTEARAKN